ncbi:MAG: hypothetical protein ACFNLP_06300 [Segatella oulorum]
MKQQKTFSLVAFVLLQAALLLSACSSEENIPASGGIAVTDAHINISVAPFETSSGKAKTRAGGTDETKADTVLLANGMRAICTVEEDDEAEQTRAPKPIADGHYTIYACDPVTGNRITGPDKLLKGTVTGGVFQSDAGTRLFLDPGTYKFVCINDAVELTNGGLTLDAGYHGKIGTVHTAVASAGDAQIGVATETISGASWQVNFVMKHQYARLRVRIVAYTDHIDNAFGYQNFAHFGYFRASCTPTGIVGAPISNSNFVHSGFTLPATSTTYNKTYVRAHDFYSSYMYILGSNDFYPKTDISIESGNIYGKNMSISSNSSSTYYVGVKRGHSYTVTYRILPNALYLFEDGSCGAYSEKGSRTAVAAVVKEKTNTEEGTAVALKDCVNQGGTKEFVYGSFPPAGTRLFKKNNTSNYPDMASTLNDVDGYKWTWETAGSEDGTVKANDNNNYTCFYAAANYKPGVDTQNIGKWYLPAMGEFKQLIVCYGTPTITTINKYNVELKFDYINLINKAFTDAGGDAISVSGQGYWTSSEVVFSGGGWASNQTPILYYDTIRKKYFVDQYNARHNNTCYIRSFIHF